MMAGLRRLVTALVVAVAGMSLVFAGAASAQPAPPPSGGITLTPASGSDTTLLSGKSAGPCNAAGANGVQVWVTGPGAFAPNEPAGRPEGVALLGAVPDGFSATAPSTFTARASFLDFAREVGLSAVPVGTYTVDFRCVELTFTTAFQTYRTTLTFTSPTTYTAGTAPVAAPATAEPTAGPAIGAGPPSQVNRAAGSAAAPGPNPAWIVAAVIVVLLAGVVIAYAVRRRRTSSRS